MDTVGIDGLGKFKFYCSILGGFPKSWDCLKAESMLHTVLFYWVLISLWFSRYRMGRPLRWPSHNRKQAPVWISSFCFRLIIENSSFLQESDVTKLKLRGVFYVSALWFSLVSPHWTGFTIALLARYLKLMHRIQRKLQI